MFLCQFQSIVFVVLDWKQEHLFNLKFAAKGLERNAKKSEKEEREEKTKLKRVRCASTSISLILLHTVISSLTLCMCVTRREWFTVCPW